MPTYTVVTYRCPRCRADVGRRLGLYTKLMIDCPNCQASVRIGRQCVAQNWAFNFAIGGGLIIWLLLAVAVLIDPQLAAMIGQKEFPADTFEHRLVIAGVCILPSMLAGLVVAGLGWLFGMVVALEDPAPGAADNPSWPPSKLGSAAAGGFSPPTESSLTPPKPQHRSIIVRRFFALLWPVVFIFGAGLVLGIVAAAGVQPKDRGPAEDASTIGLLGSPFGQGPLLAAASLCPQGAVREQQQLQAAKKLGQQAAPWLLLGTLAVLVLGCVGLLPWTGAKKQAPQSAPDIPGRTETGWPIAGRR